MYLAPQHQRLLEVSAITASVSAARGYRTVTSVDELRGFGFARACHVPGLLIPLHAAPPGSEPTFPIDAQLIGRILLQRPNGRPTQP